MNEESIEFLAYDEAKKIVANVIEEEHLRESNRRILTVYDAAEKELCWFDAEEVLEKVCSGHPAKTDEAKEAEKIAAVDYVLQHIPAWVLEI